MMMAPRVLDLVERLPRVPVEPPILEHEAA
jgi:hypothetical protein